MPSALTWQAPLISKSYQQLLCLANTYVEVLELKEGIKPSTSLVLVDALANSSNKLE
jgi:hypothetical protein